MRRERPHSYCGPLEDLDLVPLAKLDDRLLPAWAAALADSAPLGLRLHLDDVYGLHLDLEELLDRLSDLGLVRVLVHLERVLAVGDERIALLRDDGCQEDLVGVEAHDAASSTAAPARARASGRAASLTSNERAHRRAATSSSLGAITRTFSRFRKDLTRISSSSVTTTSVGRSPQPEPREGP